MRNKCQYLQARSAGRLAKTSLCLRVLDVGQHPVIINIARDNDDGDDLLLIVPKFLFLFWMYLY